MQNYTVRFEAMGSLIQVWITTPSRAEATILDEVADWFELWESVFSRFRPTSELNALNACAGRWTKVSPVMFEVLSLAVRAAEMTDGLFNPLILPALEAAGYDHNFDPANFVPGQHALDSMVPGWRELKVDEAKSAVWLPPHARLDLGGIVKGWAAQQAALDLSRVGPCLVDAGGDLVARGTPDESGGWLVTVPEPGTSDTPEVLNTIRLVNAAVATSGTDYRYWTRDGKKLHHLIDPRTGHPAESDVLSATVIAPDAVQAETWAKVSLIRGELPAFPALFVHQDGSVSYNQEFESLCQQRIR